MTILCQPGDVFHLSLTKNKFIMASITKEAAKPENVKTWHFDFTLDEISELQLAVAERISDLELRENWFRKDHSNEQHRIVCLEWIEILKGIDRKLHNI